MSTKALVRLGKATAWQYGLVTTTQAERLGVGDVELGRLTQAGALQRIAHGVYLTTLAPEPSHLELRAAWLQLNSAREPSKKRVAEEGVVCGVSATQLYEAGVLLPHWHEFAMPDRRRTRRDDVRLYERRLAVDASTIVDGLPVTTGPVIVTDLLASGYDLDQVGNVMVDLLFSRRMKPEEMIFALGEHSYGHGYGLGEISARDFYDYLAELALGEHGPVELERRCS